MLERRLAIKGLWRIPTFYICIYIFFVYLLAPYSASCAPSILITFIDMVLFNTPKPVPDRCEVYMFGGQHFFQVVFVLVALACIPVMLLGKPLHIMKQRKHANVSIDIYTILINVLLIHIL